VRLRNAPTWGVIATIIDAIEGALGLAKNTLAGETMKCKDTSASKAPHPSRT
jgi:hypothetical protein